MLINTFADYKILYEQDSERAIEEFSNILMRVLNFSVICEEYIADFKYYVGEFFEHTIGMNDHEASHVFDDLIEALLYMSYTH